MQRVSLAFATRNKTGEKVGQQRVQRFVDGGMGEPRCVESVDRLGVPSEQHCPERRIPAVIEDEVDERAERVVLEEEFERFPERRRLALCFFRS